MHSLLRWLTLPHLESFRENHSRPASCRKTFYASVNPCICHSHTFTIPCAHSSSLTHPPTDSASQPPVIHPWSVHPWSVHPCTTHPSAHPSVHPPIHGRVHPTTHPFIHPCLFPFIHETHEAPPIRGQGTQRYRVWSIPIVEYYSTRKRKEILTLATTWMNLEDIALSRQASHGKVSTIWFHLYNYVQGSKPQGQKVEWRWPGAGGAGSKGL